MLNFNHIARDQRKRYHCIRAETDTDIMSAINDGMDQTSTHLLHSKRVQKSDNNLWHFRTHLTGSIVQGHSRLHAVATSYKPDCNNTV